MQNPPRADGRGNSAQPSQSAMFLSAAMPVYPSSRFHGLGLPRLLVPDPSSHDPSRIPKLRHRLAKIIR
jgi:hypothetical protein